jgi:hypothetical protein
MLKKNPKIKNILYIALKFPGIVTLYLNKQYLKDYSNKSVDNKADQYCELMFSEHQVEESNQLQLVSNYLNPESRIVMKIDCPADEFKFIINKDFTKILSVVVGNAIDIDETNFVKIDRDVKPMYIHYYKSIVESDRSSKQNC